MLPVALAICHELSNHSSETAEQPVAIIGRSSVERWEQSRQIDSILGGLEPTELNTFEPQGMATEVPNGLELKEP